MIRKNTVSGFVPLAAVVAVTGWLMPTAAHGDRPASASMETLLTPASSPSSGLELVADRYREMGGLYSDRVQLTQVLTPAEGPAHRVETELLCEFNGDRLTVKTPWRQLRSLVGLGLRAPDATPAARARRDYDLWLAPHLVFRFRDDPIKGFRTDAVEPFAVTIAEPAVRSEQPVARFHIQSGRSWFDVFVDPASRLIVAVNGTERLADGSTLRTEMTVTPVLVDGRSWTPATGEDWTIDQTPLSVSDETEYADPPADLTSPPVAMPAVTRPVPEPAPQPATPTTPVTPRTPER